MSIEDVERLWAAAAVMEESDRISGCDRSEAIRSLEDRAVIAAHEIKDELHPLDEFISKEREKEANLWNPLPGQWWTDGNRVNEAKMARVTVKALELIRRGCRPTSIAKDIENGTVLAERHHKDQVVMRIYHLVRMAGLIVS